MESKKICVIGAGIAGLIVCKYLKQNNILFDCFEKGNNIGGLWNFENGKIYDSLHINTTKSATEWESFPMPESFPIFPSHQEMLDYIKSYALHYDILQHISFNTEVVNIKKQDDIFIVKLNNSIEIEYNYIIIATGHHDLAQIPKEIERDFSGIFLHSSKYRCADDFRGKSVLVIGIGNSAVDIACDLAKHTDIKVDISTRNSAYIYPHFVFGKPLGDLSTNNPIPLPKFLKRWIGHIVLKLSTGNQQQLGIPKPSYKLLDHHSTVSSEIFPLLSKGRIHFRSGIQKIQNNIIEFTDNYSQNYDAVIASTGYKISIPFLSDELYNNKEIEKTNQLKLYKRIVFPNENRIFFLGFIQPNYSLTRTIEEQVKWVVSLLKGDFILPNTDEMNKEILKHDEYIANNFYSSLRHTIQVDYHAYSKSLKRDYVR
ncbi:MAG: NAD(P)-binding domain-containing protein [Chitinophagales bacterium]|nr:NAD(P)-binding domain-containing protein [Chitinophagales bacterium]